MEEGYVTAGYTKLKDLPKATKELFSHLPFVFITLGVCFEHFYISASVAFMPKVIEKQFYLPAGKAPFLYGVIALTCAFFGDLTGEQNIHDMHILICIYFLVLRL